MPFTKPQRIILTVVPMTTGLFSIIGSSTIIAMVFRSKKKLGDPYRRIILGMSIFDICVSLAFVLKIFKTTEEQPNAWFALGNQTSCNILGFLHFAGLNGALLYNLSLNIYYLCLVKHNMMASFYRQRVEPFLHGVPIVWGVVSASIIVFTGHMNPAFAGDCLIAPYPVNCLDKPGVECIRGLHTYLFRMLFSTVPRFIVLALTLITLCMLWWTVRAREKKMDKYRLSMVSFRMLSDNARKSSVASDASTWRRMSTNVRTSITGLRDSLKSKISKSECEEIEGLQSKLDLRASHSHSRRRSSIRRRSMGRVFLVQACWYVLAFFLTHAFAVIATIIRKTGNTPPFWIYLTARLLSPLQGLFNIVVYTRPHVNTERKKNPNSSWFAAFKTVVASGGDDDEERTNRLKRGGIPPPSFRKSGRKDMITNIVSHIGSAKLQKKLILKREKNQISDPQSSGYSNSSNSRSQGARSKSSEEEVPSCAGTKSATRKRTSLVSFADPAAEKLDLNEVEKSTDSLNIALASPPTDEVIQDVGGGDEEEACYSKEADGDIESSS